ncbi:unnamed protein product, partial [marine sediment metagenome]
PGTTGTHKMFNKIPNRPAKVLLKIEPFLNAIKPDGEFMYTGSI